MLYVFYFVSVGPKLIGKYNFTANPDKPGGFEELSITQGEHLTLLVKGHSASKNHLWWEVKNRNGKIGFVPANYCMVSDEIIIISTGWTKQWLSSYFQITISQNNKYNLILCD
jgi:Variant SH3 domain.